VSAPKIKTNHEIPQISLMADVNQCNAEKAFRSPAQDDCVEWVVIAVARDFGKPLLNETGHALWGLYRGIG